MYEVELPIEKPKTPPPQIERQPPIQEDLENSTNFAHEVVLCPPTKKEQFFELHSLMDQFQQNSHCAHFMDRMSAHFKFLKDILSNKSVLSNHPQLMATNECFTVMKGKKPPVQNMIPCVMNRSMEARAFTDQHMNINILSGSIFDKLKITPLRPMKTGVCLPNRTIRYPRGIDEDVLVQIQGFDFPVDFVVLYIEGESPLILGRPFLTRPQFLLKYGKEASPSQSTTKKLPLI